MECFLSLFLQSTPFFLFIYDFFKAVVQTLFLSGTLAFLSWLIVLFFFIIVFRRCISPATGTAISFLLLSLSLSFNRFIYLLYIASVALIESVKFLQCKTSCQHIELIQCAERQFLTNSDKSSADFMVTIFVRQHAKVIFHPIIETFCQVISIDFLLQQ